MTPMANSPQLPQNKYQRSENKRLQCRSHSFLACNHQQQSIHLENGELMKLSCVCHQGFEPQKQVFESLRAHIGNKDIIVTILVYQTKDKVHKYMQDIKKFYRKF